MDEQDVVKRNYSKSFYVSVGFIKIFLFFHHIVIGKLETNVNEFSPL